MTTASTSRGIPHRGPRRDIPTDHIAGEDFPGDRGEADRPVVFSGEAPPLLIGGVLQQNPNKRIDISLSGVGFDYLSVTVPSDNSAEILTHHSELEETGYPNQGFRQTERRVCMAGHCWRKFEPHQPSKQWGLSYESWEYSGQTCVTPIQLLKGHPARPSRIDVAFDFNVQPDLYPMALEPLFLDHCAEKGIDIEWKGKRLKQTVYVGSQKSERRIRIYRRDLKNPLLAEEGVHILRVELELKKDYAQALWHHIYRYGDQTAYEAAASHIAHMIGYAPIATGWDLPELHRTDEDAEAAQMILQFVHCNYGSLEAMRRCGLDILELARIKYENTHNRMAESRLNKKVTTLAAIEPQRLHDLVAALLRR